MIIIFNNEIEPIIQKLSMFLNEDSKKEILQFIVTLDQLYRNDEELYEAQIQSAFENFVVLASAPYLLKNPDIDEQEQFYIESIYNGLLPHFIEKTIQKNEGSICSGDKVNFVIGKIKESITTGKNISLYQTYQNCNEIPKEKWNKQAYWSPISFKDTNEVKEKFKVWWLVQV